MIVFHSHCQMGNQMFIYACARSLSKKLNTTYCLSELDKLSFFELDHKEDYQKNNRKYILFKAMNKLKIKNFSFNHFQDNRNDYSKTMLKNGKYNWYYGYFQGEKYFFENHSEIKTLFTIKKKYEEEFLSAKKRIDLGSDYCTIHIRLKDYKTFGPDYLKGPDLTLPFSYYHNLIEKLNLKNERIVILSDEIDLVKNEFSYLKNVIYSGENMIVDFQIIKNAKININAHSTFSWWASWLSEDKNKKIYVPEYFLGFKVKQEYPVNILPQKWEKVGVIS